MASQGPSEEIKRRLDIVGIVSEYITLKKSGRNHKGLCPFHAEKTPSFMVNEDKQIYHCFGCGAGGDVLGFVMKYENLSFPETLRLLAPRAGVDLKKEGYKDSSEKQTLRDIQKEALSFFHEGLKASEAARDYLSNRGLSEQTIADFQLGFAPDTWHSLCDRLRRKGFKDPLILKSGLVGSGQRGPYDTLRGRIVFPILNLYGDIIAFGGRVMDSSQPKYLNSSDTPLFNKSNTLYAMDVARHEIRKQGYALVVEGYLDAIVCHQGGFKGTAAPLGTALTPGHLKLLGRFTRSITLVFDGDKAGVAAAKRALSLIIEHSMRGRVLLLPEGKDPDDIITNEGPERFASILPEASSAVDFILRTSGAGKTETVQEALALISASNDIIMKEELLIELSEKSGINEAALRQKLKTMSNSPQRGRTMPSSRGHNAAGTGEGGSASKRAAEGQYNEEVLLLSVAIASAGDLGRILGELSLDELDDPVVSRAFTLLERSPGKALDRVLSGSPTEEDRQEEETALIRRLILLPGFDPPDAEKIILGCLCKIRKRDIDKKISKAKAAGDIKLITGLLAEKKKLTGGTE